MKSRILPIIALSFGALFLMKATTFASAAAKKAMPEASADAVSADSTAAAASQVVPTEICLTPAIAETVARDRKAVNARLLDVKARESALTALEGKLDDQMSNIQDAKATLQAQADKLTRVADDDLNHLVLMYSTMKPKKAAEIFDNMDPAFAAGFIRQIDGVKAGLIMAEMDTNNSYKISLLIASRNAQWREAATKP